MQDWQQRVIDEKAELDGKIERLDSFLKTEKAQSLWPDENSRMTRQLATMRKYSAILGERIEHMAAKPRPTIVCLCGSTRFKDAFQEANWRETLNGKIVLSIGVCKHIQTPDGGHVGEALGAEVCAALDELHKRKIDLADEVLILNVGGYIGESTRSELDYAIAHGKAVRFLEEHKNL